MLAPNTIGEYLQALSRLCAGQPVSLLMHGEPAARHNLLLAHSGAAAAVPELADEGAAWRFLGRAGGDTGVGGAQPSDRPGGGIIRLPIAGVLRRPRAHARPVNERREQPEIEAAPAQDGACWLGVADLDASRAVVEALSGLEAREPQQLLLSLCLKSAWHVYYLAGALQDPVSQLPGRMELQLFLSRALSAAQQNGRALSVLLVGPDDFSMVNHRYGRMQGDTMIREIADELSGLLRETDGVFRYAGALFGVVLPATSEAQCLQAAEKVRQRLSAHRYLDGAEALTFSIGGTTSWPEGQPDAALHPADILRQADMAYNRARLSGGAQAFLVGMSEPLGDGDNPLSGVFMADTEKDYRNMLLLWETVTLIAAHPDPGDMAKALVDRLASGFQPDRIALLQRTADQALEIMATNVRDDAEPSGRASGRELHLDADLMALVERAMASGEQHHQRGPATSAGAHTAYAVPLSAHADPFACLVIEGRGRRFRLDASDLIFLNALASQIGLALDRAQLAAGWIREKERESRRLRQELDALRDSGDEAHAFVFESPEMLALMETVRRVAPSEATVLITGESGTGKEMLARSIHDFSHRADKPYVVFDCGAVATTLIEAELFGHVKGAFTGAESASPGKIALADGGTLFLDEVGELPMEVQAKLLRFVQEREYSAVGSSQVSRVDVRIVAATNRRLQSEVAAGRFRADLYYRLQVIALEAIPLRQRSGDVLALANHFLARFSAQNGNVSKRFTADAQELLQSHPWPGNVRELQHCVLRAVLTSRGVDIERGDIELLPESTSAEGETQPPAGLVSGRDTQASGASQADTSRSTLSQLERELVRQIEVAMAADERHPVPLGRWLTEDLVVSAAGASNDVSRQAAARVGLPESTFRRQLSKARSETAAGLQSRTPDWMQVRPLLAELVAASEPDDGENLLEQVRGLLLEDVFKHVGARVSVGAALMGVSPPTYKRLLKDRGLQT